VGLMSEEIQKANSSDSRYHECGVALVVMGGWFMLKWMFCLCCPLFIDWYASYAATSIKSYRDEHPCRNGYKFNSICYVDTLPLDLNKITNAQSIARCHF